MFLRNVPWFQLLVLLAVVQVTYTHGNKSHRLRQKAAGHAGRGQTQGGPHSHDDGQHHSHDHDHEDDGHHHHHHHHDHHHAHSHGDSNATNWYCPEGWVPYQEGGNISCLYFSSAQVDNYQLHETCKDQHRAEPVIILTKEKDVFISAQAETNAREYWLPLSKTSGYGEPFFWQSDGLPAAQDYVQPQSLVEATYNYRGRCVYLSGFTKEQWNVDDCDSEYNYICERAPDCLAGTFGGSCSEECHCAGEPCHTANGNAHCKFGCERGWAGPSCSEVRRHPDVKYFCISSPEDGVGNYVDIHICTNGVNYRSIYPTVGNDSEAGTWCPGTTISRPNLEHVGIGIHLNGSVLEEMSRGGCAGQELENGNLQWTIAIQEYEGIVMDTDLQVVISCDFNNSETMQRTSHFGHHGDFSPAHKVELAPESTDVTLAVVDPYTLQPITEAHVGSPAKLQIQFGFSRGSLVRGVCPHHCVATTPDGSVVKPLLNDNGCSNDNSPVSEFKLDTNTTGSISTQWFPLFALEGQDNVQFTCFFDLCFDFTKYCEPGCRHGYHHHRHRRDASPELVLDGSNMEWSTGVVRILPGLERQSVSGGWPYQPPRPQVLDIKPEAEPEVTSTTLASTSRAATDHHSDLVSIMNPVTFIVFLVLLVIFLALFLTLHHALVRGQQSRDRVIHHSPSHQLTKDPKVAV